VYNLLKEKNSLFLLVGVRGWSVTQCRLSDSQVEATAGEALLRTSLSLNAGISSAGGLVLGLFGVLLAALLLVVSSLHLLQFTGEALNLILVLVDLGLVHVKLSSHGLHLVGLLLEILLVN